jgi:hypothetical protein
MGKGSGKAKMPKEDAFDKAIKEQGPGLSDPVGPILQLTGMGQAPGMAGQLDFSNPGFIQQLSALPPELLQQIRMAQQQEPLRLPTMTTPKKLGA